MRQGALPNSKSRGPLDGTWQCSNGVPAAGWGDANAQAAGGVHAAAPQHHGRHEVLGGAHPPAARPRPQDHRRAQVRPPSADLCNNPPAAAFTVVVEQRVEPALLHTKPNSSLHHTCVPSVSIRAFENVESSCDGSYGTR